MISHIFKIIWSERRYNLLILLELIIVFCILWFCVDFVSFMTKRYIQPIGFDISHTYRIDLGVKKNTTVKWEDQLEIAFDICERVKKYPAVEFACLSFAGTPYTFSSHRNSIFVDTVSQNVRIKMVTPDFFDVFNIEFLRGSAFKEESAYGDVLPLIINANPDDSFGGKPVESIYEITVDEKATSPVIGVVNKIKGDDFDEYEATVFYPMKKRDNKFSSSPELSVRVKPQADKDFVEKFRQDMQEQVGIEPFYLQAVTPFEIQRQTQWQAWGYTDAFKSVTAITTFLIINIFLGIIGTFWFRVQSRRGEIGLRMALGSSPSNVKKMFISEALILLLLASIIGLIICLNFAFADLLSETGLPVISEEIEKGSLGRYLLDYVITFLCMALIIIVSVWYPSKQASEIQPADALRDE